LVIEEQSGDCHVVHTAKWDLSEEEVKRMKQLQLLETVQVLRKPLLLWHFA
jgi:hypothetical protein